MSRGPRPAAITDRPPARHPPAPWLTPVAAGTVVVLALASLAHPTAAQVPGSYPGPGAVITSPPEQLLPPMATSALPIYPSGLGTPAGSDGYSPAVATVGSPGMATPYVPAFGEPYQSVPGGSPGVTGEFQAAPVVSLPVIPLRLSNGPGTVDILVEAAPPFRGFQFVLTYDPAAVVVTAVTPGSLITGVGGTLQVSGPDLDRPGQLRYGAAVADTTTWPQGSGTLAQVTFAPIGQSDFVTLSFVEATLVDANGQTINAVTRDGSLAVPVAPAPAVQTQSVAAATAMTPATPAPGSGGSDLTADVKGFIAAFGPTAVWLVAIVVGLAIAAVGWSLGRRPTEPQEPHP